MPATVTWHVSIPCTWPGCFERLSLDHTQPIDQGAVRRQLRRQGWSLTQTGMPGDRRYWIARCTTHRGRRIP